MAYFETLSKQNGCRTEIHCLILWPWKKLLERKSTSHYFYLLCLSTEVVLLILSDKSLHFPPAIFIAECCDTYSIPIILVHDLASCYFPNPVHQPIQIQDLGLFNDKAITYVRDYFDAVLDNIIKRIDSLGEKRNVTILRQKLEFLTLKCCLCYSPNLKPSSLEQITSEMHNAKYFKLLVQSNTKQVSDYINTVSHTIGQCNSLIFVVDSNSINCTSFLLQCVQLAILKNLRIYFLEVELSNSFEFLENFLTSNQIPTHKISGMRWKSDFLRFSISHEIIEIRSPAKLADVIFDCPLHSGKWYYEVTLLTGNYTQIGWANDRMDTEKEVGRYHSNDYSLGLWSR